MSKINLEIHPWQSHDKSRILILARLISEINPKINLRDLVGLILVMMPPGHLPVPQTQILAILHCKMAKN